GQIRSPWVFHPCYRPVSLRPPPRRWIRSCKRPLPRGLARPTPSPRRLATRSTSRRRRPRTGPRSAEPRRTGHFPAPPKPTPNPDPRPAPGCPGNLTVEIIDGRTHLTAQNGREVKFPISCEKLDIQTPGGAIHASGKVKLGTDNLEGGCDRLTISWK